MTEIRELFWQAQNKIGFTVGYNLSSWLRAYKIFWDALPAEKKEEIPADINNIPLINRQGAVRNFFTKPKPDPVPKKKDGLSMTELMSELGNSRAMIRDLLKKIETLEIEKGQLELRLKDFELAEAC